MATAYRVVEAERVLLVFTAAPDLPMGEQSWARPGATTWLYTVNRATNHAGYMNQAANRAANRANRVELRTFEFSLVPRLPFGKKGSGHERTLNYELSYKLSFRPVN